MPTFLLRSRSLWDARLSDALPALRSGTDLKTQTRLGDDVLQIRMRQVHPAEGPRDAVVLSVAADEALWAEPVARFDRELGLALSILLLGLLAAVWMQVWFGLRPLARLRARLSMLRAGRLNQIHDAFPAEVQPLPHAKEGCAPRYCRCFRGWCASWSVSTQSARCTMILSVCQRA